MLEDLKFLVQEHHRRAGFICCEETCFCWEVENFIAVTESSPTLLAPDSGDGVANGVQTVAYSFAKLFAGEDPRCG